MSVEPLLVVLEGPQISVGRTTSYFVISKGLQICVKCIKLQLHCNFFQQFSRNTTYISNPGKLLDLHFNEKKISNTGDNVLVLVEGIDRFFQFFPNYEGHCLLDWRPTVH